MHKLECILLVDDDETTNFINQMLLEDMEATHQVLLACNGREALKIINQQCGQGCCPELILLDINMPEMNGFEFLEAYETLECSHKQSVVIAMLTTSLNPKDVARARDMPIKDFLNKPLTEEKVHELFREHFKDPEGDG